VKGSEANGVNRKTYIWSGLGLLCLALMGFLIADSAQPDAADSAATERERPTMRSVPLPEQQADFRKGRRDASGRLDEDAVDDGAIPNQRAIVFKDRDAMERFLAKLGPGVSVLGRLDQLNALLVGFGNEADLAALLDGEEETSMIYPVTIPEFEGAGAQPGAVALENGLLKWLGVEGDNSLWGNGVKIAILDTGIADHLAFKNDILRINLVPWPENPADLNGHGTSVATLIFSSNPFAPGVAPGATPISVRISDDNGSSNSFLIAQGIIAAIDAGAQVINISMGGSGKSALVESAVAYAQQRGVVIVASAGNSGMAGVMQPAANPYVVGVGAVDAKNQHMAFSTTGSQIAMSAPGFGVNVAYPGDNAARVNGTSFSAPVVAGALAATMSHGGTQTRSATAALSTLNANLNDVGTQGADEFTGAGVPDMWRILNGGKRGIHDAAVTSVSTVQTPQGPQAQVLVQNLGTETLINAAVTVSVNGVATKANITTLPPGDTRVVSVPIGSSDNLKIQGSVQLSGGQTDLRPSNDSLIRTSTAP
jgi:hypothetical protein